MYDDKFDFVQGIQARIRDLEELIENHQNNQAWSNTQNFQEIQKTIDESKNVLRIFHKTHEYNRPQFNIFYKGERNEI